jgi:hypothetical protein
VGRIEEETLERSMYLEKAGLGMGEEREREREKGRTGD